MNNLKAAAALNTIALAFGELAEALSEPTGAIVTAKEPSPFVDIPDGAFGGRSTEHGSLAQCPSHHARYLSGRYGPYCPAKSDDPAWANKKGYCTITPDSAAEWLRVTAA